MQFSKAVVRPILALYNLIDQLQHFNLCCVTRHLLSHSSFDGCFSAYRVVPAFVAVTAAAGAYLLGKSTSDSRVSGKKNKKVVVPILLKSAPELYF